MFVSQMRRAKDSGDIIASYLAMMEAPTADEVLNEGWIIGDIFLQPQSQHMSTYSISLGFVRNISTRGRK